MPRSILTSAFALLLTAAPSVAGPEAARAAVEGGPGGGATVERSLLLMGTRAVLRVTAVDRKAALGASEAAIDTLERAETRLSTWSRPGREPGELARLNQAPAGRPVALSPALADELGRAEACRRVTGGAFDPAVGALVAVWGLRSGGRLPSAQEIERARQASGEAFEVRPDGTAVRRSEALRIDEGGFGKGAGIDAALAVLDGLPGVLGAEIDLGGQIAVLGPSPHAMGPAGLGGRPAGSIDVALADPAERSRPVARLDLPAGSVATSGNSERGVVVDGKRIGHLLDPRTGRPAPDFGSLTVWAGRALEADCLATGLYVLGPERALAWAEAHPGVEVAIARSTRPARSAAAGPGGVRITITSGLAGRISALSEGTSIELWGALGSSEELMESSPAKAGMKAGAEVGSSVASEVPNPRSPSDRGQSVSALVHASGTGRSPCQ